MRNAIPLESLHDRAKTQVSRIELSYTMSTLTNDYVDLNRQDGKHLENLLPTSFRFVVKVDAIAKQREFLYGRSNHRQGLRRNE
jgi:hypothetical protein